MSRPDPDLYDDEPEDPIEDPGPDEDPEDEDDEPDPDRRNGVDLEGDFLRAHGRRR